ncbi:hypothetical protein [Streptomyces sp. NPDC001914]|uniref:hypothetical protein n=1 Tax=Streptomyces sp. NPDC001914 TaxID=3364623 RepID=UPI0036971808
MGFSGPRHRVLAAVGLAAALALTATACGSGDDRADGGALHRRMSEEYGGR